MGIIIKTIKRSYSSDMRKEDENKIINDFMERHDINDYTINPDKSVDVNDDINIYKEDLIDGKLSFKFGKVTGHFKCIHCYMTSLEGCPEKVDGYFDCSDNQLTTLEGCPEYVGDDFICSRNNLTSFEVTPKEVGGNFYYINNNKRFTKKDIEQYCKVKGFVWVS